MLAEIRERIVSEAQAQHSPFDPRYRRNLDAYRRLQEQAAAEFGRINSWRVAEWFPVHRLGCATRGNYRDGGVLWCDWADHPLYYRAPRADGRRGGMNVAMIGQPYGLIDDVAEELDALRERDFAVHMPPQPRASIYFPGRTLFLVVTRPGIIVKWLPEQIEAEVSAVPDAAIAT